MAENKNYVIGITQGDINGISYEVIIKSLSDNRIMEICTPVVYGLSKVASYHKKYMEMPDFNFQFTKTAEQLSTKRPNLINIYDEEVKLELGTSTKIAGQMSERSLYAAGRDLKNKLIDAIVTAPMNKNNIQSDKFTFSGHAEFFNHYFGGKDNPCLMMLVSENLRMGFVTNHLPVKSVAGNITTEGILQKIETLNLSLKKDFALNNPTIAVLALNQIGREEPEKYENKTVRFKGLALKREKIPKGCIVIGRHVMTCCAADIQYAALVCQLKNPTSEIVDNTWISLTAKINIRFHKAYMRRGPVLTYVSHEPCIAPDPEVATFY